MGRAATFTRVRPRGRVHGRTSLATVFATRRPPACRETVRRVRVAKGQGAAVYGTVALVDSGKGAVQGALDGGRRHDWCNAAFGGLRSHGTRSVPTRASGRAVAIRRPFTCSSANSTFTRTDATASGSPCSGPLGRGSSLGSSKLFAGPVKPSLGRRRAGQQRLIDLVGVRRLRPTAHGPSAVGRRQEGLSSLPGGAYGFRRATNGINQPHSRFLGSDCAYRKRDIGVAAVAPTCSPITKVSGDTDAVFAFALCGGGPRRCTTASRHFKTV